MDDYNFSENLKKLFAEIKFKPSRFFEGMTFDDCQFKTLENGNEKILFFVTFQTHLLITQFEKFYAALYKKFNDSFELIWNVKEEALDKKTILDYSEHFISQKYPNKKDIFLFLKPSNVKLENKHLILSLPENYKGREQELITSGLEILKLAHFSGYSIDIKILEAEKTLNEYKEKVTESINKAIEITDAQSNKLEKNSVNFESSPFPKRRSSNFKSVSIKTIVKTMANENVETIGEIYKLETKITKNNKNMISFFISDYEEAIKVLYFASIDDEQFTKFKVGQTIRVRGQVSFDFYKSQASSKVIMGRDVPLVVSDIQKIPAEQSKFKRVELANRTNMSAHDGISTVDQYLKAAKEWGHDAIAITDLDNVQNFPNFYLESLPTNIKPIYGATLTSIDTNNNIVFGESNFNLFPLDRSEQVVYVVYDIETTGLSARFNDIIEFGATYVVNGKIKGKEQFFLKPNKPIPSSITELTNITNEMVDQGFSQKEGIQKIYDILKDKICVAHNARFDINFCKQKFSENGLDISIIRGIDTLPISWLLFPKEKKHTLKNLAEKFNITYSKSEAHRGDYDAMVLANVWTQILQRFKTKEKIYTADDLRKIKLPDLSRKFGYEVRMLAKNKDGLKKLYQYIMHSLTTNYYGGPRFLLNNWLPDPDLLLGSGTNFSFLWEEVINGSDENIIKALIPFDYIELPPISTFNYLYSSDWITREQVETAYIDLINKAKKMGKICVAVSDSRYVYDYQKLIHDIYINTPSLGGGLHKLEKYRKYCQTYFRLLTTQEMLDEFAFLRNQDLIKEIVIDNTYEIANQIEKNIEIIKNKLYIPKFDESDKKLEELVYKEALERYGKNIDPIIAERIHKELSSIIKYGYSVIYWISHLLVKKSNKDGFVVGSRGSVGSSIVANLSQITEVNPLPPHYLCEQCKYFEWSKDKDVHSGWDLPNKLCPKCNINLTKDGHNIPFETFLGFEAEKVPDIDLNFSGEYQPTIHSYVRDLFGKENTFRAGTIMTVAEKTAYGYCKKYAEKVLHNGEIWSKSYFDFLASKTQGVKRTSGQHPGGIVIIPKEYTIEDFTPANFPSDETNSTWLTTHFDYKKALHDSVLKLDLLGHDDPTSIKMLESLTNVKVREIPKMDEKTIKLFYSLDSLKIKPEDIHGETTGALALPEFGTKFIRGMLKVLKPKTFNELILISGLSHGENVWSGNADELVKNGVKLIDCICCRDDIMKNLIDRGVDKQVAFKIMEDVRKGKSLTAEYLSIIKSNRKIPSWYQDTFKKIKYLFPKAHATAYVIMAWRFAWYKVYYPLEFYAAYFSTKNQFVFIDILKSGYKAISNKLDEFIKRQSSKSEIPLSQKEIEFIPLMEIAQELYARGLKIKNVDLKLSDANKWIVDKKEKALIPPFAVVEGLGSSAAESIVKARKEHEFVSIEDLKDRTKLNTKTINVLKELGVLDDLDETNQMTLF